MTATPDISKLPKWAQEHITRLERQRDEAKKEREDFLNAQKPSAFYEETSHMLEQRNYIQTNRMTCEYDGVKLEIIAYSGQYGPGIRLSWEGINSSEVALIPLHHQSVRLVAKEDME